MSGMYLMREIVRRPVIYTRELEKGVARMKPGNSFEEQ